METHQSQNFAPTPEKKEPATFRGDLFTSDNLPTLLTQYPENSPPQLNRFGQQQVVLPEGVCIFSRAHHSDIYRRNDAFKFEKLNEAGEQVLSHRKESPSIEKIELAVRACMTGFRLADNSVLPTYAGMPLEATEASLMAISRDGGIVCSPLDLAMPFKSTEQRAIVPLVGDVHINNRELTRSELEALRFAQAGRNIDGQTQPCFFPALLQGGRSALIPAMSQLLVTSTKEGGFEIVETDERYQALSAQGAKFEMLPILSTQFVGVGIRRYVAHLVDVNLEGKVNCRNDELIITNLPALDGKPVVFVQREAYAGKSGIFLDVLHQPYANSPVGGCVDATQEALRDRLLLARGAKLAGATLGTFTLFTREQLATVIGKSEAESMVCEKLSVAVRVLFDDTRRLDSISFFPESSNAASPIARHCAEEVTGRTGTDASRAYLYQLASTLGKNLRIATECGFTLPYDQKAASNLSVIGGIIDSDNFAPMTNRLHCYGIIRGWAGALWDTAKALGEKSETFSMSPAAQAFMTQFLGAPMAPDLLQEYKLQLRLFNSGSQAAADFLSTTWVTKSMAAEGKRYAEKELAQALTHPLVKELADFSAETLQRLQSLLLSDKPYCVVSIPTGGVDQKIRVTRTQANDLAHRLYIKLLSGMKRSNS